MDCFISKQLFVPKTKLNINKVLIFTVAVPILYNQLSIITEASETGATFCIKKPIFEKLLFRHDLSLVPCSSDDVYLCPFMITPNDFVAPLGLNFVRI